MNLSDSDNSIVFENSQSDNKNISNENKIVRFDLSKSSCLSSSKDIVPYVKSKKKKLVEIYKPKFYKDIFLKLKDEKSEAIVSYSDKNITCFRDIDENSPKHYVIVSNKKPSTSYENLGELSKGVIILIKKYNIKENEYKLFMRSYHISKKEKILYLLLDLNNL